MIPRPGLGGRHLKETLRVGPLKSQLAQDNTPFAIVGHRLRIMEAVETSLSRTVLDAFNKQARHCRAWYPRLAGETKANHVSLRPARHSRDKSFNWMPSHCGKNLRAGSQRRVAENVGDSKGFIARRLVQGQVSWSWFIHAIAHRPFSVR